MIDLQHIDDLARRLSELVPPGLRESGEELQASFRGALQAGLGRLDLVTREEFVNTVADYLGKPRPGRAPEWLGRLIVGPVERIARARGRETPPFLTRAQIKFMTLNLDFSIAKAKRMLGYRPIVDFQEGIVPALDYATGKIGSRSETEAIAAV